MACSQKVFKQQTLLGNADDRSTKISSDVVKAMGGMDAYNKINGISWTFFGSRRLWWDKQKSRVRIESPKDTSVYIVNLNTLQGRYFKNGVEVKDAAVLEEKMKEGKSIWINDSYWLVMPFKLRDQGVHLKYVRQDTISGGYAAEVLELTFSGVGNTPDNKYEVYVDDRDNLIKQWAYFKQASQEKPDRIWPWDNYKDHNGVLISDERSDKSGPSKVKVYDKIKEDLFSEL